MESQAARRYAKALFNLSRETGKLEEVRSDMQAIHTLLAESAEFSRFVGNYLVPLARRQEIFKQLLEGKVQTITHQFLLLLEEKKRLPVLEDCCRVFEQLYYELKGIVRVKITSAHPMTDAQINDLTTGLKEKLSKEIDAETAVDASLIGGFKIRVGDHIHDASVSTQLELLRHRLIHA